MAPKATQPSSRTLAAHAKIVLEVAGKRTHDISDADVARLCESAIPLASTDGQRQALAFKAGVRYERTAGWGRSETRTHAIRAFETAAGIEGPLSTTAALHAGHAYIKDADPNNRVFHPDKAISWLEQVRAATGPLATGDTAQAEAGSFYVSAIHGLVHVHTHSGSRIPRQVVTGLIEEIAEVGKTSPHREVSDAALWALQSFDQGGCGSAAATRARELIEDVGHPSNYVEELLAAV